MRGMAKPKWQPARTGGKFSINNVTILQLSLCIPGYRFFCQKDSHCQIGNGGNSIYHESGISDNIITLIDDKRGHTEGYSK